MNNLSLMNKRLNYNGGNQEGRMIKDKFRAFQKSLSYSYQGADIIKEGEEESNRALINPDKNSTNYDDKILSVDRALGYKAGDIFTWVGTNTHWIVYLPEYTEDAYFRSQIRRCRYKISWLGPEIVRGEKIKYTSYVYVRGPVETKINFTSKNNTIVDNPNYSLEIYIPNTSITRDHFKRYQRFAFNNKVWKVEAIDSISTEGILQVVALEDYENPILDDLEKQSEYTDNPVTDAFYITPVKEKDDSNYILGDSFVKPFGDFEFKLRKGVPSDGEWYILEGYNEKVVTLTPLEEKVIVHINQGKSGQFTLCYSIGDKIYKKVLVIESLF